jgi:hypothetical protein
VTLLLQPEVLHCRKYVKNMMKYSSSINKGCILNIISALQNTITINEKAECVAKCNSTQLDDGEHTAPFTPHDKSILLLKILPLQKSLCNLAI